MARLLCSLLVIASVCPLAISREQAQSFAFVGATIVDVRTGALRPRQTVVVVGQRIAAIGRDGTVRVPVGARQVDATGKFLIPGLWNMHVHSGSYDDAAKALPKTLACGITGVRDMGSPLDDVLRLRSATAHGTLVGPRMVVAGPIVQGPLPFQMPLLVSVRSEPEARAAVAMLKARGVDFIKVQDALPRDLYLAVIDEAKRRGLPVAGHIPPSVEASEVCDVGQASVEHLGGSFMGVLVGCSRSKREAYRREQEMVRSTLAALERGEEPKPEHLGATFSRFLLDSYSPREASRLFERFARRRTWHCPTLVTLRTLWEQNAEGLTPEDLRAGEAVFAKDLQIVGAMHRSRVRFLAGTDLPLAQDPSLLCEELALLVRAGMTPLEALQTATRNPAEYLGMSDRLGAVEAGKLADLVLLDGNPLDDIGYTRRVNAVVANGRLFDRTALDEISRR